MHYGMVPDPEEPGGFRLTRKELPASSTGGTRGTGGKDPGAPAVPEPPERFCCSNCDEPIAAEHVIRIEAEKGRRAGSTPPTRGTTGYMLITHLCPCSPLALTSRRYRSYKAFVGMFGRGVTLPYQSPFQPAVVAPDDALVRAWRWELEQTTDFEDFLFWLEHRRSR